MSIAKIKPTYLNRGGATGVWTNPGHTTKLRIGGPWFETDDDEDEDEDDEGDEDEDDEGEGEGEGEEERERSWAS